MRNSRRIWLKTATGAALVSPLILLAGTAHAAKNDSLRTSLQYKDAPNGTKQCSGCAQFVPGKTAKDKGGCKIIPGDTEIAPNGSCIAWSELKK
jgi:High potential iron-sulfur protein